MNAHCHALDVILATTRPISNCIVLIVPAVVNRLSLSAIAGGRNHSQSSNTTNHSRNGHFQDRVHRIYQPCKNQVRGSYSVMNVHCELYLSFPSILTGLTGMSENPAKKRSGMRKSRKVLPKAYPQIYGDVRKCGLPRFFRQAKVAKAMRAVSLDSTPVSILSTNQIPELPHSAN